MALRSPCHLSILLFAAAASTAHAAELGEARVQSHIGQALMADVELSLVEDGANPVRVRLANPDVYRGANIAMPAVLSSLNMTVMRRDGRQFLRVTSLKPVESRHLHLYLELLDGTQRGVRLVTLWLTPDPNPAPAARPAAALQAGEEYVEAAPLPRATVLKKPLPMARVAAVRKPAPETRPQAPSCAPQPSTEHLDACVVLGEKNAVLRHDLVRLEEKVKALQGAAGASVAVHPPPAAPVGKAASGEVPRIHRMPKKVAPSELDTPWLAIGAGLAAVLAAGVLALVLLRRRQRAGFGKIPPAHKPAKLPKAAKAAKAGPAGQEGKPKPNFMAAVKGRLMPRRGKEAAVPGAEPVRAEVISNLE